VVPSDLETDPGSLGLGIEEVVSKINFDESYWESPIYDEELSSDIAW